MRRILEDLYHGNLTASGQTFRRGTKYARALARLAETEDALGRHLAPEDHPLLGVPNLVCTPHVGFDTRESIDRRAEMVFENITEWMNGTPVRKML